MPKTLQQFVSQGVLKEAEALTEAFARIPEDKRDWKPAESSRSALDLLVECAIVNGSTASSLTNGNMPFTSMDDYYKLKDELKTKPLSDLHAMLKENTAKLASVITAIPDDKLDTVVQVPWGAFTIERIATYPVWNMGYHEGQINYIASLLGCLA